MYVLGTTETSKLRSHLKLVEDQCLAIEVINHKFMTSGHSYLTKDSDFGYIQKFGKWKLNYTLADWHFATAKSQNETFVVTEMT
jgi:hypothetical protein